MNNVLTKNKEIIYAQITYLKISSGKELQPKNIKKKPNH